MNKSFGYDVASSQFRVARHEVGDFGLHISLIRAFAWGDNRSPQSPFYPGKPLVYHYAVDWISGQLVRQGIRIDYALNGVSAIAMSILLYMIFLLTKMLFDNSQFAGILTILLFLLPGNLSFIDILKQAPKNTSFLPYLWRFSDYMHKGPFDGSLITIYTTLAPYLNQRHLIAGMAIGLCTLFIIVRLLKKSKHVSDNLFVILGIAIGLSSRVHLVVAAGTTLIIFFLLIGKKNRALFFFILSAFVGGLPHLVQIFFPRTDFMFVNYWNPGFLSPRPLTAFTLLLFWWDNLGLLIILIPFAFRNADSIGRRILIGVGVLFLLANCFQISYRIEHNHSLVNYLTVLALPFVSNLLVMWWKKRIFWWRLASGGSLLFLTTSGIFNLMVVKNDYQLMVDDAPKNKFILWIKTETAKGSIFLSKPELYDPVTLAGRYNYLGHEYYVSVMGFDYQNRLLKVKRFYETSTDKVVNEMREEGIKYIVIPKLNNNNFPYSTNRLFWETNEKSIYSDKTLEVFSL